jgi:gamma-glutamylaminecyclotransferase
MREGRPPRAVEKRGRAPTGRRYARPAMRLFVYGSLLSGEIHASRLGGARLVGPARTAARYTLVDLGPYPALLEGGTTSVSGEVYEVDGETLAALDEFEGHPDEYRRQAVSLLGEDSVEAYVRPRGLGQGGRVIASGSWRVR